MTALADRPGVLFAIIVASAVIAAGCGGDDAPESAATTVGTGASGATGASDPEKTAFLEAGNEICRETSREIDAAAEEEGILPNSPIAEIVDFAERVAIPGFQERIDRLAELTSPEGDEDEVEEIIEQAQEALDAVEDDPQLLVDADPFEKAEELSIDYGLTACSG